MSPEKSTSSSCRGGSHGIFRTGHQNHRRAGCRRWPANRFFRRGRRAAADAAEIGDLRRHAAGFAAMLGQFFTARSNTWLLSIFRPPQIQKVHKCIACTAVGIILLHPGPDRPVARARRRRASVRRFRRGLAVAFTALALWHSIELGHHTMHRWRRCSSPWS